jgi:hypothetical protein
MLAMKVQLEHRTKSCPDKLLCTVCGQIFAGGDIRALLFNHRGFLQGDVCEDCLQLRGTEFRYKLRDRANLMLKLSELDAKVHSDSPSSRRDRALELLDTSKEAVYFPAPFQWWLKRVGPKPREDDQIYNHRYEMERSRLDQLLQRDLDLN